jgi:hypothetical protein
MPDPPKEYFSTLIQVCDSMQCMIINLFLTLSFFISIKVLLLQEEQASDYSKEIRELVSFFFESLMTSTAKRKPISSSAYNIIIISLTSVLASHSYLCNSQDMNKLGNKRLNVLFSCKVISNFL